MSEESKTPKAQLKQGDPIIANCPFCRGEYDEPLPTNIQIDCAYPQCLKKYMVVEL